MLLGNFTTSKNKLGEDSPFPKFIHLKVRRRNDVESLRTLEEGEFKLPIDGCISILSLHFNHIYYVQVRSQTFQNERTSRGLRGEQGGELTGTQNGGSP